MGGSGPPCNTWFPGPTQVLNRNGSLTGAAVFAGLTSVTDRQTDRETDRPTDRATRSVTIGRIYVRSTAMRPNNDNDGGGGGVKNKVVLINENCQNAIVIITVIILLTLNLQGAA